MKIYTKEDFRTWLKSIPDTFRVNMSDNDSCSDEVGCIFKQFFNSKGHYNFCVSAMQATIRDKAEFETDEMTKFLKFVLKTSHLNNYRITNFAQAKALALKFFGEDFLNE